MGTNNWGPGNWRHYCHRDQSCRFSKQVAIGVVQNLVRFGILRAIKLQESRSSSRNGPFKRRGFQRRSFTVEHCMEFRQHYKRKFIFPQTTYTFGEKILETLDQPRKRQVQEEPAQTREHPPSAQIAPCSELEFRSFLSQTLLGRQPKCAENELLW
jgi:hypothetical protein